MQTVQAINFFPTTTGVLCTIVATNPTHVLVGVKVKTSEGVELQMIWQPKERLYKLNMDLREGIVNADLMSYHESYNETAIVRFSGRQYANMVGFDQLC